MTKTSFACVSSFVKGRGLGVQEAWDVGLVVVYLLGWASPSQTPESTLCRDLKLYTPPWGRKWRVPHCDTSYPAQNYEKRHIKLSSGYMCKGYRKQMWIMWLHLGLFPIMCSKYFKTEKTRFWAIPLVSNNSDSGYSACILVVGKGVIHIWTKTLTYPSLDTN